LVSRRLSRPLLALTDAARSFAAGDPQPNTKLRRAPGEIGELGRAFTDMANTVREQDALRRAVIADVAHELRTPVTILRGQTEQLLDGIAEPTPQRLASLHDEVLRLGRLTDDLATLSAADAAGLELRPGPVELGKLVRQTVEAMSAHFAEADLHVSTDADDDLVVLGDTQRLAQVTTNLLTNAAKYTPPGGKVSVSVRRSGSDAVLTVTDTGPGIAADELPHVFERFWRGRAAGTRSGTGVWPWLTHWSPHTKGRSR
jgi:two-component system sensor histidine kinase BaeS